MVNPDSLVLINQLLMQVGIKPKELIAGKVILNVMPDEKTLLKFRNLLLANGYSLIDDKTERITFQIKAELNNLLINGELNLNTKLSVYLSNIMNYQYHYLSNLFSDFENISIEKYFISLKIEKAKELISLNELSFTEIAHKLGYSSSAHFTNQFKKLENKTPTEFKLLLKQNHEK